MRDRSDTVFPVPEGISKAQCPCGGKPVHRHHNFALLSQTVWLASPYFLPASQLLTAGLTIMIVGRK